MYVYMHDGPALMQMSEMLTYIPDLQYYVYCAACLYVAISSDINSVTNESPVTEPANLNR